ncbi:MAG TPA: hypothetical protein VJK54_04905 [Chthoniobacterales bacterium]|nr:hypothetical protein [Chthoniobacterales bacterium]
MKFIRGFLFLNLLSSFFLSLELRASVVASLNTKKIGEASFSGESSPLRSANPAGEAGSESSRSNLNKIELNGESSKESFFGWKVSDCSTYLSEDIFWRNIEEDVILVLGAAIAIRTGHFIVEYWRDSDLVFVTPEEEARLRAEVAEAEAINTETRQAAVNQLDEAIEELINSTNRSNSSPVTK